MSETRTLEVSVKILSDEDTLEPTGNLLYPKYETIEFILDVSGSYSV